MNQHFARPVEILLVEDSAADARLMREALENLAIRNRLHVVSDGVEATSFLHRLGRYADAPRPDLIILDLNLPKKDGLEVLAEVRADGNLKNIPVIIMTTSDADADVLAAYNSHANCYITKSADLDRFFAVIAALADYWFNVAKLPTFQQRPEPGGDNDSFR